MMWAFVIDYKYRNKTVRRNACLVYIRIETQMGLANNYANSVSTYGS